MGSDRPEHRVADRQLTSMYGVFIETSITFKLVYIRQIKEKSYPNQLNHGYIVGLNYTL